MCGIVGFITSDKSWKSGEVRGKAFTQLLITDTLRGMDSTGVFTVDKSHKVEYYKKALPSWDFLQMKRAEKLFSTVLSSTICIGHNRAATKGKVDDGNAHPFDFSDVIGVHNGTLKNDWDLSKDLPDSKDYTVDSERMYAAINEYGYKTVIPKIEGAFTLVWYDKEDKVLRAIRNENRPLSFCTIDNEETVFIASELDHLRWIVGRNNYKAKFYNLEVGTLIEFPKDDPRKFVTSKMELFKKKENTYQGYGGYHSNYAYGLGSSSIILCKDLGVTYNSWVQFKPTEIHKIHGSDYVKVIGEIPSIKSYRDKPVLACGFGLKESDVKDNPVMIEGVANGVEEHSKEVILSLGGCRVKTDNILKLPDPKKGEDKRVYTVKHLGREYVPGFTVLDLSKKQSKEWKDLSKDGCMICDSMIVSTNLGNWIEGRPICIECQSDLEEGIMDFQTEADDNLLKVFPPLREVINQ